MYNKYFLFKNQLLKEDTAYAGKYFEVNAKKSYPEPSKSSYHDK